MRYWIHWNDLVQGPFELEELVSLKAFSEELPVCMEDRDDWVPARLVADLSPALEQMRSTRIPSLPPPPPPKGRPRASAPTLQGEFFGEPQGQMHMFDLGDRMEGPQAYVRVEEDFIPPGTQSVFFTTPIHFTHAPQIIVRTVVAEPPPPAPVRTVPVPPPPPPVAFVPPPIETPKPVLPVETIRPVEPPPVASPIREPIRFFQAPKIAEIRPPIITESAVPAEIPVPETIDTADDVKPAIPLELAPDAAEPLRATPLPDFSPEIAKTPAVNLRVIGWALGIACALLVIMYGGYSLFDYMSSRSAIEAARKEVQSTPVAPAVPVPVKPVAVVEPVPEPRKTAPKKKISPVAPTKKAEQKAKAKPAPVVVKPVAVAPPPPPAPEPEPISPAAVMPGVSAPAAVKPPEAAKPASSASSPAAVPAFDPWIGRHNDAIAIVTEKKVAAGKQSIGSRARIMLEEMHDKELLHAADTGERLYEPDKVTWSALREEGSRYRVYLNFSALQVNGERVQTRSYQFQANLASRDATTDDVAARKDFLEATTMLTHARNPRAKDIENMISGVDLLNKHKMRAIIVRNTRKNTKELKDIEAAVTAAEAKLQRSIAYFRSQYNDKMLMNVAKAYGFSALVK